MIKRILVVMDPTVAVDERQRSFVRALEVSSLSGASIDLLLVLHNEALEHRALASQNERKALIGQAHAWLTDAASRIRDKGFNATAEVRWDNPRADAIVRAAVELNSDLIVKQSQHDGAFSFGIFSNTDWTLAGESPVPVMFAKAGDTQPANGVLAALELATDNERSSTNLDRAVLESAATWGGMLDTTVVVGHAYLQPDHEANKPPESRAPLIDRAAGAGGFEYERVRRFLSEHDHADYEIAVDSGPAWQVIPRLALAFDCGLVVMGARDHNVWERVTGKAQSEHALAELPCDVLFVKEAGFVTNVGPAPDSLLAIRDD